MDYELKRVIAFCIIVKLVALSSELSIKPETERLNQSTDTVKPPQLTSLAGVKEPPATSAEGMNRAMHFNLGPGEKKFRSDDRKYNKKYITKSEQVRINSAFDTCEHMAELLESSKWRDIQKTLHWFNRVLAGKTLGRCRRKSEKMKSGRGAINKKVNFDPLKMNSKGKSNFEMKKKFPDTIMKCRQSLINSLTPHNILGQSEKLKKECKGEYKSGKNKLKHSHRKKPRRKTKKRKKTEQDMDEGPNRPNNTKGILSDSVNDSNLEGTGNSLKNKERWPVTLELKKLDGKNLKKENPWPNFVYHRVSSDLFHLTATDSNHKQSAYVAISVNTSGEMDAVKNRNKMFGL